MGSGLTEKREKSAKIKEKEKKKGGPFKYFLTVSSVLILVMWVVIIFGGQKPPQRSVEFSKKGRVFLFMVDSALKRYARYENNKYPKLLTGLVPKYLSLDESELIHLEKLSYERDTMAGYRLFLANPKEGEMNLILSPRGIENMPPSTEGA